MLGIVGSSVSCTSRLGSQFLFSCMADICSNCPSSFPLSALASSSFYFQVRISRSFKLRDNWSSQHLMTFALGGSGLYYSSLGSAARYRYISRLKAIRGSIVRASSLDIVAGSYEDASKEKNQRSKSLSGVLYPLSIACVLPACIAIFSAIALPKGVPSAIVAGLAKSGFTAAFTLIFISEIGDKTFFITALLAMQYGKMMVLCGSMGALSLMTILSVVMGRIFQSVPAQFQTTLPIGEYAAAALFVFFGLKAINDALKIPSDKDKNSVTSTELGEFAEAEELVKVKVSKNLAVPLDILWKSFSLVFSAECGDRSMLATIALAAAQSPWGVACGAIAAHLFATSLAILGGAFLSKFISEKLIGCIGGALFLMFAAATLFGVF